MSAFHWDLRLNKMVKYCRSCSINFSHAVTHCRLKTRKYNW